MKSKTQEPSIFGSTSFRAFGAGAETSVVVVDDVLDAVVVIVVVVVVAVVFLAIAALASTCNEGSQISL